MDFNIFFLRFRQHRNVPNSRKVNTNEIIFHIFQVQNRLNSKSICPLNLAVDIPHSFRVLQSDNSKTPPHLNKSCFPVSAFKLALSHFYSGRNIHGGSVKMRYQGEPNEQRKVSRNAARWRCGKFHRSRTKTNFHIWRKMTNLAAL